MFSVELSSSTSACDSDNDSMVYNQLKTRLSESQAEVEELNQSQSMGTCVIGLSFRFCLGLRESRLHWIVSDGNISGVGRKWKRSDSSNSDSVVLITLLTTPILILTRSY